MLHVTEVVSNVKGGVSAKLAPKTLIVGPNGTGKSAIPQAISFALRGQVEDISGRADVASDVELMALSPDGISVEAAVTLSNGEVVRGALSKEKGKVKKWVQTLNGREVPPIRQNIFQRSFPLTEVRAAILGSADTARKFFVRHSVGDVTTEDVLKAIPKLHHDRYQEIVKEWAKAIEKENGKAHTDGSPSALAALLAAEVAAKSRKSAAKSQADTYDEIIKEGTAGLAPQPTEEQLKGAEALCVEWRKKIDEQQRRVWELQSQASKQQHRPHTPVPAEYRDTLGVLKFSVENGLDHCVACGTAGVGRFLPARLEAISVEVEKFETANPAWSAPPVDLAAERERQEAKDMLDAMKVEQQKADVALTQLRDAVSRWSTFNRARDQAEGERKKQDDYERLDEALRKARVSLLDGAIDGFVARVQKYLPPTDRFGLRLREGEREVLQFGLVVDSDNPAVAEKDRKPVLHTALSGAEWARVTVALAAAVAERDLEFRVEDEKLSILVPEDRSWDGQTLASVLDALRAFPGQVIVATTSWPSLAEEHDAEGNRMVGGSWRLIVSGHYVNGETAVSHVKGQQRLYDDKIDPVEEPTVKKAKTKAKTKKLKAKPA